MPLTFNMNIQYGEMRVQDVKNKNTYKVKIVHGNCLAVWITETETEYNLWFFLADKAHGQRIMKGDKNHTLFGPWSNIKSIKLNMYHKECHALLDLMVKSGYKVQCYYKEPKSEKEGKYVRK